jgi:predicted permease
VFERVGAQVQGALNLTGNGDPERLTVARVTGEYFNTMGVAPLHGRTIRPDEAAEGADHVVVLSYGFWKDHFGGDANVVHQHMSLNGEPYEIVGVMPATFKDFFSSATQLYVPIFFPPAAYADNRRTNEFLNMIGRLKPGVSVERAKTVLHEYAVQLRTQYSNSYASNWDLQVTGLADEASGNVRTALYILLGAVGMVLLIACANVANLLLARTAGRAREVAVRVALGASPSRLMRQLLTESVLLAVLGGGVGMLLAVWGVPGLLSLNPMFLPPTSSVSVDPTVLAFALAVSLGTGLLFGFAPALQVARADLHTALKEGGRAGSDRAGLRMRRGLVVTTMALAMTLLAGAGLLVRSFARVTAIQPGFKAEHLLTFTVALPPTKYGADTVRAAALNRIADAVQQTPGVIAAGGTSNIPFGGNWSTSSFNVEGYQPPTNTPSPWGDVRVVTPGYLPAMGVPLLKGRQFTVEDRRGAPAVTIVDEEMVRRYWPNADPIGKRITFNRLTDTSIAWITVVGVVGHMKHEGLDAQPRVQYYFPLDQGQSGGPFGFVARTSGDPMTVVGQVRGALHGVDPDLPLAGVNTMDALIEGTTGPRRFSMLLLGGFAGLAMLLASIGLYGVMSYTVAQRTRELGVRVALGASAREVSGMVLRQGARLTFAGVLIGLVAAFVLTRLMRNMLFDISATDPVTFVAIPVLLLAVALLASYLPARRATRVDPIEALRSE